MSDEDKITDSLRSFGEESMDITTSALRVLAMTALFEADRYVRARNYIAAREAANALLQTLAHLETGSGGAG